MRRDEILTNQHQLSKEIFTTVKTILEQERAKSVALMAQHPSQLRLHELETLRQLAENANVGLYLNVAPPGPGDNR